MVDAKEKKRIVKLYTNPNYNYSFSNLNQFRKALALDFNISISRNALRDILNEIPLYVKFKQVPQRKSRNNFRRFKYQGIGLSFSVGR